jgi:hypothetical protein
MKEEGGRRREEEEKEKPLEYVQTSIIQYLKQYE